jgi:hypothetical protein
MVDVVLVGAELEENLALRYLHGALVAERFDARIIPFDRPSDVDRAAADIVASGARICGLSMVFTRRADEFARLAVRARELGYRGRIVAGGHFAAFHADRLLADVPAIDVVAIGEGERLLCALAREGAALEDVPNLVWRDGEEIRRSARVVQEQNLDTLAWPTHRRPFVDGYLGLPIVNMIGSRGCSFACGFCSIAAWHQLSGGDRYRARSARDVAGEMGCLWREGVRLFNFHDDNFLGRDREKNLERVRDLGRELDRQQLGQLGFQIKARPDAVDPELFGMMREMGLFRVFLGIEAGTERSLKDLGRGQKLDDNRRALDVLNSLDLHVAFNLLVLNPESTFEDFAGNVGFLREHLVNPMNFCRTEVYTGTPIEKRLRKADRLRGDYWGLDYEIADTRAQRAFDLFREAFWDRNFGPHPLHYLSGQVDYEHQIRMDFFGTTPSVRASAKAYVRAVNENTVSYLEEVIDRVRVGTGDEDFAKDLFARVREDDVRLAAQGQATLALIRDLSDRNRPARPGPGRGQAAVAAIAIALAGCNRSETHQMEAAPPPPPTDTGPHMMEAAPPPPTGSLSSGGVLNTPPIPTDDWRTHASEMVAPPPPIPVDAGQAKADAGAKPKKPDAGSVTATPTGPTFHAEAAPRWDPKNPKGTP